MQSAVDTRHHLIVAHEVTNVGIDTGQLLSMAEEARHALDSDNIEVLADKGYYNSEEIAASEDAAIAVYVPKPNTSNSRAQGRFDKRDFVYDVSNDRDVCPVGQHYLPHDAGGKRPRDPYLLDERLRGVSAKKRLHNRQGTPRQAMGARAHPGAGAGTARSYTGRDAGAARDYRAHLRHPESLDGGDALQDDNAEARCHGDGAATYSPTTSNA